MVFETFIGATYPDQSWNTDREQCVNWFVERPQSAGAKAPAVLMPTPGMTTFCTLPLSPGRGVYTINGRLFAVGYTDLYEIFQDGSYATLGTMLNDDSPATFSSNGDAGGQVFITSGTHGYIFDLSAGTLTDVLTGATQGGFLSSFFVALDVPTATVKISAALDGTTWPGDSVIQRSTYPDRWQSLQVVNGELRLLGSQTSDTYYPTGETPVPFGPNPAGYMQVGTGSGFSTTAIGTTIGWLGQNVQGANVAYLATGYSPERISTHALEYQWAQYQRTSDAVGWSYQQQGHTFFGLTFPTANASWVYDLTTGAWHERGLWNSTLARYDAYRPMFFCEAFGQTFGLDRASGVLYTVDVNVSTDVDGNGVRRLRRSPHLCQEQQYLFYKALQLDMQTGMGLTAGQGSAPQVMLRYSNDGGNQWGNAIWRTAGAIGAYKTRVRWFPLGSARDRVFEVSVSDPVHPWAIQAAYLDVEPGVN